MPDRRDTDLKSRPQHGRRRGFFTPRLCTGRAASGEISASTHFGPKDRMRERERERERRLLLGRRLRRPDEILRENSEGPRRDLLKPESITTTTRESHNGDAADAVSLPATTCRLLARVQFTSPDAVRRDATVETARIRFATIQDRI